MNDEQEEFKGLDLDENFDTTTKANEGVEIFLKDLRSGQKTIASITILGSDSEVSRQYKLEKEREILRKVQRKEDLKLDSEEALKQGIETLCKHTIGWKNLVMDGKPLEYSNENAKILYRRYPAIRDQIDKAIADRTNFLRA